MYNITDEVKRSVLSHAAEILSSQENKEKTAHSEGAGGGTPLAR